MSLWLPTISVSVLQLLKFKCTCIPSHFAIVGFSGFVLCHNNKHVNFQVSPKANWINKRSYFIGVEKRPQGSPPGEPDHQGVLDIKGDSLKMEINQVFIKKPREIMGIRNSLKVAETPPPPTGHVHNTMQEPREGRGSSLEASSQTWSIKSTSRFSLLHLTSDIAPETVFKGLSQGGGHCPFQKFLHLGTCVFQWLKHNSNSLMQKG